MATFFLTVPPALAVQEAPACEETPPAPPVAPDAIPDGYAEPYSVYDWDGGFEKAHLGIGHLAVEERRDYWWAMDVVMPLYDRPDGSLVAWINRGFVEQHPEGRRAPLSGAGLVETSYEDQTIIVYERTPSGWLRVRTRPPTPGAEALDGTLWTHECLLSLGETKLRFERWEDVLTRYPDAWAFFRSDAPHVLREGPGIEYSRRGVIGPDHELFILEVAGHWMRVRVREPAWTCAGRNDRFTGTVREGWVNWWGNDRGPRIWYPTRGC